MPPSEEARRFATEEPGLIPEPTAPIVSILGFIIRTYRKVGFYKKIIIRTYKQVGFGRLG